MSRTYAQAVHTQQLGQTLRYHTEIVLRTQDVAQHSFNVAWLCWLICDRAPSGALIMAALAHDGGERGTGDIPAPTKRSVPGMGAALDTMEAVHMLNRVGYSPAKLNEMEQAVLKMADALDGFLYCLRERLLGNRLVFDSERGGAGLNFHSYCEERLRQMDEVPNMPMEYHRAAWEIFQGAQKELKNVC